MEKYPKLKTFIRLKKLIEKKWFLKLLTRLYKVPFFKQRIDDFLEGIVLASFPYGKSYKFYQSRLMLSFGEKKGPWEYAIKYKNAKAVLHNNYSFEILFEADTHHLLKMFRKQNGN